MYYFEIPVNKGEFALGSTSGQTKRARGWGNNNTQYSKNGAYLLYLDIGASAKNTQGITINDSSTTTINKYLYPKGIDFKDITGFELADYQAITGGESAAIVIPEDSQENINYTYTPATEGKALLSAGPTSGSTTIKVAYKTTGTDVKNKQNGEPDIVAASSSIVDQMEREILYDLRNFNSGSAVTPTVTEIHTYKQTGQADKTATYVTDGEAVTLTSQIISSIANIDPNGAILYEVNYSNILSDLTNEPGSDYVRITSTYDLFDREYTSAFASTAQNKKAEVIFINLSNLSQTYGTAPNTTSVTYHVIFTNLDEDNTAIGELSASDQNKLIIIICTQVSS